MRNLDLLIPKPVIPNDWWTWGTITGTAPLRVRLDGDDDPLDTTPENLAGYLTVGTRVWVQMNGRRAIITATNGNQHYENRLTAVEDDQALLWDAVAGQEADIEAHDNKLLDLEYDTGWISTSLTALNSTTISNTRYRVTGRAGSRTVEFIGRTTTGANATVSSGGVVNFDLMSIPASITPTYGGRFGPLLTGQGSMAMGLVQANADGTISINRAGTASGTLSSGTAVNFSLHYTI